MVEARALAANEQINATPIRPVKLNRRRRLTDLLALAQPSNDPRQRIERVERSESIKIDCAKFVDQAPISSGEQIHLRGGRRTVVRSRGDAAVGEFSAFEIVQDFARARYHSGREAGQPRHLD